MTQIQLTKKNRDTLQAVLTKLLPEATCLIFGSRAKGYAKPYSDLDLAIDTGAPIPLTLLAQLDEAFDDSNLPFIVDIVDWQRIDKDFQQHILAHAIALQN